MKLFEQSKRRKRYNLTTLVINVMQNVKTGAKELLQCFVSIARENDRADAMTSMKEDTIESDKDDTVSSMKEDAIESDKDDTVSSTKEDTIKNIRTNIVISTKEDTIYDSCKRIMVCI